MGSLTAEQLADKLGTIKKKLSGAELIADDKVVKNFVDLNVPVNSEVFNFCVRKHTNKSKCPLVFS